MSISDNDYKYDVAFSFLNKDEELALKINDLIQDRLRTFISPNKQEEIAGTDGEKTFNRVFGSEARIVVVLYRKGWGETPWTRIEETAIRKRAFDKGYDFCIFIPLDIPPCAPEYLPPMYIWVGIERWGIDGAASVIESRVQLAGGTTSEETAVEYAQRIERQKAAKKDRKNFLHSDDGVNAAYTELDKLFAELQRISDEIMNTSKIRFHLKREGENFSLSIGRFFLNLSWFRQYANSLEASNLRIFITERKDHFHENLLKDTNFDFDRNSAGKLGWQQTEGEQQFFSSTELARECMKRLLTFREKSD